MRFSIVFWSKTLPGPHDGFAIFFVFTKIFLKNVCRPLTRLTPGISLLKIKIKMFDKSNKNFIWDCSKIVCSCPCTVVLDYVEMWRHSHWLCRHDVRGHSETTMPTWISAVNFGRLSLTLKEQSSKNKYLSVFTFTIAIFWKVENGVLPKAKVVCLENFNLCNWISRLKISWHSPFKSFTFTMTISVAT